MRLRTLLAAAFAGLALTLTLAGALAVQHLAAERLRARIGDEVAGLAGQIRTLLDTTMQERLSDMQVLSSVAAGAAPGGGAQRAWIKALHAAAPTYAWIGFADRDGTVRAATGGLLEGRSVAERPWFREALKGPHAGDVREAKLLAGLLPPGANGEPLRFVDVAAPLRDAAGEVVGVVGGHLSWSWADHVAGTVLAAAAARAPQATALVLGRDGTVLLGPPGLRGTRLPDHPDRLPAGAMEGYSRETWADGRSFLVGASRSVGAGAYAGLGWTVLVLEPADTAFAPARRLSLEIAAGGGAFAVLFALVGWGAAGRIAAPLLALSRTAESITGLDEVPDAALRPRGCAEARTLAGALAALLARLRERDRALAAANRTLEDEVAARTRDLAQSRGFLENILRTSPDCIKVLDGDGHLTFINDRGLCLLELDAPQAVMGCRFDTLLPPESRAVFEGAMQEARTGRTAEVTLFCPGARGTPKWWDIAVAPLPDPGGPDRFLVVSREVTRQHEQAEALRLARDVAELAQARAENASRAKTEFVAMMSHEIRTPLNAIKGFADLLAADRLLSPTQRRYAEIASAASQSLSVIVDDVLDFAKIEAGQITLEPVAFALPRLIEDAVAVMRHTAEAKGLALAVEIDPALAPWRRGDDNRLRQVLLNFLGNAAKFTAQGRITVSARPGRRTESVRVAVSDTGIGIPADRLGRLFQTFSQADGSVARRYGGTGLGLAIAKRLIELMGGRIGVESREGEGSTFWFEVDLPRESAPAAAAPAAGPARTAPVRPARLLLADDLAINLELARVVLERAGYAVDVVDSGEAAVAAVPGGDYDLVLIDVQMPGMDGLAATRAIRALNHPARNVPIIAMSANVLPEQVALYRAAGMNDHVGKPFAWTDLYATIERWLPDVMATRAAG
ncbi:ATP-binding protein [Methylobacterium isbiliense]|uniref:histidine kinase n=1 Tax=Methylobacterium isbiliense TaxID=315478 RepID=A0ABQ4S974_9HYPH|nr:ATP-binding protein [Methylobacterium isbiliense]MDN3623581.1 ATP-binding protein [Methylobacterium isbiliense]GJD99755.1 Sensor histidine kinase RcsC [Methylobacterium isbiliense]